MMRIDDKGLRLITIPTRIQPLFLCRGLADTAGNPDFLRSPSKLMRIINGFPMDLCSGVVLSGHLMPPKRGKSIKEAKSSMRAKLTTQARSDLDVPYSALHLQPRVGNKGHGRISLDDIIEALFFVWDGMNRALGICQITLH